MTLPQIPRTYEVRDLGCMDGCSVPQGWGVFLLKGDDTVGSRVCHAYNRFDAEHIRDALKDSDLLQDLIAKGMVF